MLRPQEKPDRAYAWLEKIENGTLVHYQVPVKHRMKNPGILSAYPDADISGRDILEIVTIGTKTVYCRDLEEVFCHLKAAELCREEIEKLERDGKLGDAYKPLE